MKKPTKNPTRRILTRTLATLLPTEAVVIAGGRARPECYTTCGGDMFDQCDPM